MAQRRPQEYPAWLRDKGLIQAEPLDVPDDPANTQSYLMACAVSGATSSLVLISWKARDRRHAEVTFQDWLDKGWGVLSRSFFNVPCRWVFRTGAVNGFVVLPDY
jgi:hypothetical protein